MVRKIYAAVLLVGVLTVGGAQVANAAGQTDMGNGRSLCHYSGLNDNPDQAFPEDGRVQSYGRQFVSRGVELPDAFHPGQSCNPNVGLQIPE